jgi:hypothetical protein
LGSFVIKRLNKCFPRLKHRRQFRDFEVQRSIREPLTKGTRLRDSMMKGPPVRFEVKEMVVIALLMS